MDGELFMNFVEAYTPTEEDLQRELTNEQLKELCLRVPCRVDMWKWNKVQDYVVGFERQGRLQNKTRREAHKLLAKAVNRHKEFEVYTDEIISEVRVLEWQQRKKDMLMNLDLWEYDREQAKKANLATEEGVDSDEEERVNSSRAFDEEEERENSSLALDEEEEEVDIITQAFEEEEARENFRQALIEEEARQNFRQALIAEQERGNFTRLFDEEESDNFLDIDTDSIWFSSESMDGNSEDNSTNSNIC